jgi:hypothetical protein
MYGLKKIDIEVTRILWNTPVNEQPGVFRMWRHRMNEGKLSLDKKLSIIEDYSNLTIHLVLKEKTT